MTDYDAWKQRDLAAEEADVRAVVGVDCRAGLHDDCGEEYCDCDCHYRRGEDG